MKRTISDEDVISLFRIYENLDVTQKELADAFQITQGHLSRILAGLRRKKKDDTMKVTPST